MRVLGILAVFILAVSAQDANPSVPFYGYGSIVASPNPPILGAATSIDVTVSNNGAEDAFDVEVQVSFNTWGVVFDGWQTIGTQIVDIPQGRDVTLLFSHVFISRTHTCLEVKITDWGTGGNSNLGDDRGQINLEVVHSNESDLGYEVPIVNNGKDPIDAQLQVGCLVNGKLSTDCPRGVVVGVHGLESDQINLEAGEELRAEVYAVGLSSDAPVDIILEATSAAAGESNHVLLQVVPTTFSELVSSQTLCCLKRVKDRVFLGTILLRALQAYEDNAWTEALRLLRVLIHKASLVDCRHDTTARACLEQLIAMAAAAARMLAASASAAAGSMAAELTPTDVPEGFDGSLVADTFSALRSGDSLRLAGEYEAATLQYQAMHYTSCGVCAAHIEHPRHHERFAPACNTCRFLFTSVQYPYQLFTSVQGPYRLFTEVQYPYQRRTSVQWPYQLGVHYGVRRQRQQLSGTAVTSVQYPYQLEYFTSVQYPYQLTANGLTSVQWPYRLEAHSSVQGPYQQNNPTQLFAHNIQQQG